MRKLAIVFFVLSTARLSHADESASAFGCWRRASVCPCLGGTPSDYCRKPCPVLIRVPRCGGPEDYCGKTAPCLIDVPHCGGVDDYCRKSIPYLLCPPASPYLYYGPPEPCCAPSRHR